MKGTMAQMKTVEKYGLFELRVKGETSLAANFSNGETEFEVKGFLISESETAFRFMPQKEGAWIYRIGGDFGEFQCVPNTGSNHGPVVTEGYHFKYADGAPYFPVGTTLYAWTNQTPELIAETLETLKNTSFNKVRMCVFPKRFDFNWNEPERYPFQKNADGIWNVSRPDFEYWDGLDTQIKNLYNMGIEVDLILLHPYDCWGFCDLSMDETLVYIDYCIRRFSAYRNIWWSLANEYDLVVSKSLEDWDAIGKKLATDDVYGHLISSHNWITIFPKTDWLTHVSFQGEVGKTAQLRREYELPVIIDEFGYEGNLPFSWGNLSGFELVNRAWRAVSAGGYVTHGDTFYRDDEVIWWAKGGKMYGESEPRFAFLKSVLYEIGGLDLVSPKGGLSMFGEEESPNPVHSRIGVALSKLPKDTMGQLFNSAMTCNENYRLSYLSRACPCYQDTSLPKDGEYRVEAIDVWDMTRSTVYEGAGGEVRLQLPGKEGIAILVTRISGMKLNA